MCICVYTHTHRCRGERKKRWKRSHSLTHSLSPNAHKAVFGLWLIMEDERSVQVSHMSGRNPRTEASSVPPGSAPAGIWNQDLPPGTPIRDVGIFITRPNAPFP